MAGEARQMPICTHSDSKALDTTSAAESITIGGTVDRDSIYVGGIISASPISAVNVNGQLAPVTAD